MARSSQFHRFVAASLAVACGSLLAASALAAGQHDKNGFHFNGKTFASQKAFVDSGARCSTRTLTDLEQRLFDAEHSGWLAQRSSAGRPVAARPNGSVNVPVYFHVINNGSSLAQGNIPDSQVAAQIAGAQRGLRQHTFHLHADADHTHDECNVVHDGAGFGG